MNTAQGYVYGLFQSEESSDCGVQVNHWNGPVPIDPYIATVAAGICSVNTVTDLEAFYDKIGSVGDLINTYSSQLADAAGCNPVLSGHFAQNGRGAHSE